MDARSATDIWAVGGDSTDSSPIHPLVEHWDGHTWSTLADSGLPFQPPPAGFILDAVSADAAADVWAVGTIWTGPATTLVEHWDGTAWRLVPTPVFNPPNAQLGVVARLDAVLAFSARDVWTVGTTWDELHTNVHRPLIEHWDGSSWHVMSAPAPGTDENELSAIVGTSSTDIWAAGYAFSGPDQERPLIEHWDGHDWKVVASAAGADHRVPIGYFTSLAMRSANDIWAVGSKGRPGDRQQALAEHWDGQAWQMVPTPSIAALGKGTPSHMLTAVSVAPTGEVWAVGMRGVQPLTASVQPIIEQWYATNGWRSVLSPIVGPASGTLVGVAAVGPNDAWAIGGAEATPCGSPEQLVLEHWDGSRWQLLP